MTSVYDFLDFAYNASASRAEIRAQWNALHARKEPTMKTHSFPHLSPQQYDDIMAHVTAPDADLLALARAVDDNVETYMLDDEKRRSFRLGDTEYIFRAESKGISGALWQLCEWLDAHRPIEEPPTDDEDTKPLPTGGSV